MKTIVAFAVMLLVANAVLGQPDAVITRIEGSAQLLKAGSAAGGAWRVARLNMPLQVGDQLKSGAESLVEITYRRGAVLRLDENSICCIKKSSESAVSTSVPLGNVWVNMKKLTAKGSDFDVSTPTAVAAIRGTVFQMQSMADSSADVAVFDGKVAVGLSDEGKNRADIPEQNSAQPPHEVPGPTEVPGPYEVTLDQWKTIVAGQRISIRSNGTYATSSLDLEKKLDAFVEKNRALDAEIKGAR
jgi:hypothetical protein